MNPPSILIQNCFVRYQMMKKLFPKCIAYLVCALLTCLMLKNILGIGTEKGIQINHDISTGPYGSIHLKHSGHCRN
jgi:hypothetical protein